MTNTSPVRLRPAFRWSRLAVLGLAACLVPLAQAQLVTTYKGVTITFHLNSAVGTIPRPYTGYTSGQVPAYDYSIDLMHIDGYLRLYHGGRFTDAISDGDHTLARQVADAGTANIANWIASSSWISPPLYPSTTELPRALWRKPEDTGAPFTNWDSGNYMDPEVMKVESTYYHYSQVEIKAGDHIDDGPEIVPANTWADRIQLYTSANGQGGWSKYYPNGQNRGVVVNLPAATRNQLQLHHHEMLYEAGTAEPYVMYVFWNESGVSKGMVRMRSTTPHTFDWNTRQSCTGMAQLGNKIGYCDVPGGRLYVRISHIDDGAGKRVPTFYFSSDGLNFSAGSAAVQLIGHPTLNTYFLGLSTLAGTGQLNLIVAPQTYHISYGAAASTSAVAPDIYQADVWLGKTRMTVTGTLVP